MTEGMHRKLTLPSGAYLDVAPCGLVALSSGGTLLAVNKEFARLTGYAQAQLLDGMRFQELLSIAGKIFFDTHMDPLLRMQGFVRELAFELLDIEGKRVPVLVNAYLEQDESNSDACHIHLAIIEARSRRSYEEELRVAKKRAEEAEAKARKLTNDLERRVALRTQERDRIWRVSQDIFTVLTERGSFVSVSPAFQRILGWSEDSAKALSLKEIAHSDDVDATQRALEQLSTMQPVEHLEVRNLHSDGSYRWVAWKIFPSDKVLYGVGRDITDEKNKAEALAKTQDALRQAQKLEAIGKLTGGVAHDFNNILQVISGNLELLRMHGDVHTHSNTYLESAISAVSKGADLASRLLSFARKQPLKPTPTDLGALLRGIDQLLQRTLGEAVDVSIKISDDLWVTSVDQNLMENVILNLAINARDAMCGEGQLSIELDNTVLDEAYTRAVEGLTPGQFTMLTVTDTGVGMPEHVKKRVFEPFFTTKPEGSGTGLGLSMVYGFVKQSGGHISIYSEEGKGTSFRIYLPRVQAEAERLSRETHVPTRGGTEHILVVEDNDNVRESVTAILASLGYRVSEAENAVNALAILKDMQQKVDLLFTDVIMPGSHSGPQLAEEVKRLYPSISVLFTSGYTFNALKNNQTISDEVPLISKPYTRDSLAKKIREVLDDKSQNLQSIFPADGASSAHLKLLVVEDDVDSRESLIEMLELFGHQAKSAISAEQALEILEDEQFNILLTDVSLPGQSGVELAQRAQEMDSDLAVVFVSGHGAVEVEGVVYEVLAKPLEVGKLKSLLSQYTLIRTSP